MMRLALLLLLLLAGCSADPNPDARGDGLSPENGAVWDGIAARHAERQADLKESDDEAREEEKAGH